jgi:hypothetical protein
MLIAEEGDLKIESFGRTALEIELLRTRSIPETATAHLVNWTTPPTTDLFLALAIENDRGFITADNQFLHNFELDLAARELAILLEHLVWLGD